MSPLLLPTVGSRESAVSRAVTSVSGSFRCELAHPSPPCLEALNNHPARPPFAMTVISPNSSSMPSSLSEIPARTRSALLQTDVPASPSFAVDLVIGYSAKLSAFSTKKLPKTVRDTQLKDRTQAAKFAQTEYAALLASLQKKGLNVTSRKAKVEPKDKVAKAPGDEDESKVWVFVSATEETVQSLMQKERSVHIARRSGGVRRWDEREPTSELTRPVPSAFSGRETSSRASRQSSLNTSRQPSPLRSDSDSSTSSSQATQSR
jgi:hypothetical protein